MQRGMVYSYPLLVARWVDGDTVMGVLDLGYRRTWQPGKGIRLVQGDGTTYDAPERRKATMAQAVAARERAHELALPGMWLMCTSHSPDPDDFGRPLCSLLLPDGRDLAGVLIMEGHVK